MTNLENLEEAEVRIKDLLIEARGMIKDLRAERKNLEEFIKTSIREKIELEVAAGLDEYKGTLERAIKLAEESMFKRFDTIMEVLLGEDRESRKKGEEPLIHLLQRHIDSMKE
jgi:F0F1-type ATP synthase membrane subunit b/b'